MKALHKTAWAVPKGSNVSYNGNAPGDDEALVTLLFLLVKSADFNYLDWQWLIFFFLL